MSDQKRPDAGHFDVIVVGAGFAACICCIGCAVWD